jgi:ATP synthase protein I
MERPDEPASASAVSDKKVDADALARLDSGLAAVEARRARFASARGGAAGSGPGDGYKLLSQMLGGVLGGVGLGWLVDRFAHTGPWGLLVGVFGGMALSIYSTVRMAIRAGQPPEPANTKVTKTKVTETKVTGT